ncbi:MAG: hypothetical protein ABIH25_02570 [Candidatus Woesearchaeota archaeon]
MKAKWKQFWLFIGLLGYGITIINAAGRYGSINYNLVWLLVLVISSVLITLSLTPNK